MTTARKTVKTRSAAPKAAPKAAAPGAAAKKVKSKPAAKARPATRAAQAVKTAPTALVKVAPVAAAAGGDARTDKPKKPKLVRDSFTIPKAEYLVLEELKQRAARAGAPAKKSELLRAGIKALAGLGEAAFLAALGAVPAIKTGRPAKA
jgi:hypothetical protein